MKSPSPGAKVSRLPFGNVGLVDRGLDLILAIDTLGFWSDTSHTKMVTISFRFLPSPDVAFQRCSAVVSAKTPLVEATWSPTVHYQSSGA
jgi:hypothetical protein